METQPALIEVQPSSAPAIPPGFYKNKPRPNHQSDEVLAMVADKLINRILQWGRWEEKGEQELKEVAEQILAVLKESTDGYKMAKELEGRFYWYNVDSELVDILDSADFYGAEREMVLAWIRDNNKKNLFFPGRLIHVYVDREKTRYEGVITKVYEDGCYCVMIPGLGHVSEGNGTHGMVFKWEDVEGEWNQEEIANGN